MLRLHEGCARSIPAHFPLGAGPFACCAPIWLLRFWFCRCPRRVLAITTLSPISLTRVRIAPLAFPAVPFGCSPGMIRAAPRLFRARVHNTAMSATSALSIVPPPSLPRRQTLRMQLLPNELQPKIAQPLPPTLNAKCSVTIAQTARPRQPAVAPTVLHASQVVSPARQHEEVNHAASNSTTFESQTNMVASEVWTRVGDAGKRDWQGFFPFFNANAPTDTVVTDWGTFDRVVVPFGNFSAERCFSRGRTTIVDARTHSPKGKDAWHLEAHGFCYVTRPEYAFEEHEQQDFRRVNKEFAPKVLETVRKAARAKRAFWLSHMRRGEPSVRKVGIVADGYVLGFPHSDYGPDNEAQFRKVMVGRYGVDEEEAQTCGLCLVNLWAPVNRTAYKNPLAYLDCTTLDLQRDSVRYILDSKLDTGYDVRNPKPLNQRVPIAAKDCPALGPIHRESHRWVYLSDMTESEAVIFKQYDFRAASASKATFHQAFPDPYHDDWDACPPRRSIECRILLTFDPEPDIAKDSQEFGAMRTFF